jgi:hypothetical protein
VTAVTIRGASGGTVAKTVQGGEDLIRHCSSKIVRRFADGVSEVSRLILAGDGQTGTTDRVRRSQATRFGATSSSPPRPLSRSVASAAGDTNVHLTLKKEATKPAAANVLQQQARFDDFIACFNQERPHQALGMKVPADVYTPRRASIAAWRSSRNDADAQSRLCKPGQTAAARTAMLSQYGRPDPDTCHPER